MANLRSTVIMKTDICGFTTRVKNLSEFDLSSLLNQHKIFISDIAAKNEGSIVKGEGDSFWIIFPSVTTASLAAVEMQQELRAMQPGKGDDERLAIRIAIALGDVLHQDRDIFGDTVNLTARIESVTPPDEIYLSQAAWLALNKAEVRTAFVNEFSLKGMSEPEKLYKIDQKHKTRIIKNQAIVFTNIRNFPGYQEDKSIEEIELFLNYLDQIQREVCESYGGTIRLIIGDAYFLTFPESYLALAAVEKLCNKWTAFIQSHQINCGIAVGIHKGDLNIFRSCIYGTDINMTARHRNFKAVVVPDKAKNSVIVSERIKNEIVETKWEYNLQKLEIGQIWDKLTDSKLKELIKANNVYELIVEGN